MFLGTFLLQLKHKHKQHHQKEYEQINNKMAPIHKTQNSFKWIYVLISIINKTPVTLKTTQFLPKKKKKSPITKDWLICLGNRFTKLCNQIRKKDSLSKKVCKPYILKSEKRKKNCGKRQKKENTMGGLLGGCFPAQHLVCCSRNVKI